jgi:hypothetical protein
VTYEVDFTIRGSFQVEAEDVREARALRDKRMKGALFYKSTAASLVSNSRCIDMDFGMPRRTKAPKKT